MAIPPVALNALNFTGVASTHKADSPEKIKDAASQFEALMIGQILKAAHGDSDEGAFGGDADPASASAMDFANDYFARAMAAKGGLGLTNMIVAGLQKQATPAPDASPDKQATPVVKQ
jgi:Rod binding domain-containing protein